MTKLTAKQQEQLNQLKNGPLFVGYNCRTIMNTFDKLVTKGFAKVIEANNYGKRYATN